MHIAKPDEIGIYTVIVLEHAGRYLLLRRANCKRFAPGRWTGVGGRVEPSELGCLRAAALRELRDETGITPEEITHFVARRALLHLRDGHTLTLLLYFTGGLAKAVLPPCSEGTLAWVGPEGIAGLDVIESTQRVLPLLLDDCDRDPQGREQLWLGVARYRNGALTDVMWV